jgi:hypothetical protein
MKMDAVRNQLNRPLWVGIVGFVVGVFIGLIILGWWLWPVKWTNAAPEQLQKDYQADYLRMAVDSYIKTQDVQAAKARWDYLGNKASTALANVKNEPLKLKTEEISAFEKAVAAKPGAVTPAETEKKGSFPIVIVLVVMCLVTLLIAGGIIVFVLFRGGKTSGIRTPAQQAEEAKRQAQATDYSTSEAPPIAQFMASYKQGDDLFDDSFSIDSPSGEFLGECGVGISETIGVGDPKKVTAFEVWLFDKNDIQTVTKVLMSAHAFGDDAVKQRLAAKGEPVEAKTGEKVVLETQTLKLEARVVDMTYGEGALPPQSFFDQAILELAIWQKA